MAENIFKKASAYRRQHPRVSFQDAIKKVSGIRKVSGSKKVSGVKKKAKLPISSNLKSKRRISAVRDSSKLGAISGIGKAEKINADIIKLEAKRKKVVGKEMRDIVQLAINKRHKQLDAIKRQLR